MNLRVTEDAPVRVFLLAQGADIRQTLGPFFFEVSNFAFDVLNLVTHGCTSNGWKP
jgi:hypothetical protein